MTRESEPVRVDLIYDGADRWHSHAVRNADDRLNHRHPLHKNHSHTTGDAEQAQSALTLTQPVPSGLDLERLSRIRRRAEGEVHDDTLLRAEVAEDDRRMLLEMIDALTAPVADEDNR